VENFVVFDINCLGCVSGYMLIAIQYENLAVQKIAIMSSIKDGMDCLPNPCHPNVMDYGTVQGIHAISFMPLCIDYGKDLMMASLP